jgi:ABC transporter, phosphonate, periplasmic substrate-binding protein
MRLALYLLLISGLTAAPAAALGHGMAICYVGGPGNTKQAAPVVATFLRHMEQASGLKAGSMTGEYHTTRRACLDYIKRAKPSFGVFDLATYLNQANALKLKPLACMGKPNSTRYHLLVREGSYGTLKALQGKQLISSLVGDLAFVSKIIFKADVDAGKHFKIKYTRRPLKGIRRVVRERADATLVDNMAYNHLGELKLPVKLKSIYRSPGLPGLTMASLDGGKGAEQAVKKIVKALPKLCGKEGNKMCQTFNIKVFSKVRAAAYNKLVRAYNKK